jgi:hypothetical protein
LKPEDSIATWYRSACELARDIIIDIPKEISVIMSFIKTSSNATIVLGDGFGYG